MARLFISYASSDKEFTTKLANDLKDLGHEVWIDQAEIEVGQSVISSMGSGLASADYMVLVLSPDAVRSRWVEQEWKAKYWQEVESGKTSLLPILVKDCDVPPFLRHRKYADFRSNYTLGFARLVKALVRLSDHLNSDLSLAPPGRIANPPSLSLRIELCEGVAMARYFLDVSGEQSAFNICVQPWSLGGHHIVFHPCEIPAIHPIAEHSGTLFVYHRSDSNTLSTVPLLPYLYEIPERQITLGIVFQNDSDSKFLRTFALKRHAMSDRIDCFRDRLTHLA